MDIIHHALIGGAGFSVATAADQPLIGAAFVIGSLFPDLDVIFMLLGKRFYLKNHQAITHSLLLAPLYATGLCFTLLSLLHLGWSWVVFLACLFGLLLHIGLDWFNTFRIALFSPFLKQRYSLDAVFFIDSITLFLTAAFYLLYRYYEITIIAIIYPLLFSSYLIFKLILQRRTVNTLDASFAIPSSLNPFEFYILEEKAELTGYLYNSISIKKHNLEVFQNIDAKYQQLANKSSVYKDIKAITRCLQITSVTISGEKMTILAEDLAVRNFGGKFARTTLKFDLKGNLLSEVANI
ncbi:MAG: metal-dependent hydrolase [Gammaproteobacteria bacterium]|nr:metal-dependent hydrolase [Gammaproteobacteria bacterium]